MKKLLRVFVTQFLFVKVMSSYAPYAIKSYIARESPSPPRAYVTEHKVYQNYPQNYAYPAYKIAEPVPRLAEPIPRPSLPEVPKPLPVPKILEAPSKCSGNLDSHVLNNLAIALQLLIVNNIINNPPDTSQFNPFVAPLTDSVLEMAFAPKLEEFQMPNSKFLGSSNFGADVMSKGIMGLGQITPRAGLALMSPYDAIANMPDNMATNYMSKRDFQSPYAAIMAADNHRDLFSMADLFY